MANPAKKKEKHRLKRLQKKRDIRKVHSITPLHRIAASGGTLECWINKEWRSEGVLSLAVYGRASDGRYAYASFLVDLWCVGLKDVFGKSQITRAEIDDAIKQHAQKIGGVSIDVEKARELVVGSIRFSRDNGFKLPPDWAKWASLFGDLGDIARADLSEFGKDGGLMYVGDEEFLRRRLIGCTPSEFLAQTPNLLRVGSERMAEMFDQTEDDDDEEVDESEAEEEQQGRIDPAAAAKLGMMLARGISRIIPLVRTKLQSKGIAVHPRMEDGVEYLATIIVSTFVVQTANGKLPPTEEMMALAMDMMRKHNEADPNSLCKGMAQVMSAFGNGKEEFSEALVRLMEAK